MSPQGDFGIRPKLSGGRISVVCDIGSFGEPNDLLFPFICIEVVFETFGNIEVFAGTWFDLTPSKHFPFDIRKLGAFTCGLLLNPVCQKF